MTDSLKPGAPVRAGIDRNLALELVRATEAAALAASRHLGRGDKEIVDQAAVDAMRPVLNTISMRGTVVIGEGEKDEAPMLYNGEEIGMGGPQCDIAVDPIDGTTLTSLGRNGAIAVSGDLADVVDLTAPIETTLAHIAKARGVPVPELTVCILDRPRHEADLVRRVREAGSRIKFLLDGDVAGAIMAATPDTNVDLMVGIGGTPEGVLAACALKCLGGAFYGRLYPRNDDERRRALDAGYDLDKVLTSDDLCRGDDVFFSATGVTDGDVLQGVRYRGSGATTESLVMRSRSGTVRRVHARHDRAKLRAVTGERYG